MVFKSEPHPWLQPPGRRIGVTVFCALWLGFELWSEPGSMWCWMAAAALGWALWDFFLSGNYQGGD
ncbi:MAG: hypothetical protein HC871_00825 [Rhizobiales bacterium]|nr:hypothetical protein [Hyphomicrobiales bacterium]